MEKTSKENVEIINSLRDIEFKISRQEEELLVRIYISQQDATGEIT